MAKDLEQKRRQDIDSAIRGLYSLFPDIGSRSCHTLRNAEIAGIEREILKREAELEKDTKLVALRSKLAAARKRFATYAKAKHQEVDALLRRFQLRGESDQLLKDVEKLAASDPVLTCDCDCD